MSELGIILAVEDSDEDFEVLRLALLTAGAENPLLRCTDAGQALKLLNQRATEDDGKGLPILVLLDLNLPDMDGLEFLRRIHTDARLGGLPVIVLSSSTNAQDVLGCYRSCANVYLVKPAALEKFEATIRTLVDFWLCTALLPLRHSNR